MRLFITRSSWFYLSFEHIFNNPMYVLSCHEILNTIHTMGHPNAGLSNVRPAGHIRPAASFCAARDELGDPSHVFFFSCSANLILNITRLILPYCPEFHHLECNFDMTALMTLPREIRGNVIRG